MPSGGRLRTVDAAESLVSCATTVATNTFNPVTIVFRDANGDPCEGIPASLAVLTVSGADNTVTQPTGPSNALGVFPGAGFQSSSAGNRTPTVTFNTRAIAGPVVAVGTASTLSEFVDWRTATGTGDSALEDGGKITSPVRGSLNLMEVKPTSGDSGWPVGLDNYVDLSYNTSGGNGRTWQIGTEDEEWLPLPDIGESQWRRWYWKNDLPNGAAIGTDHGFESNIGTIQLTCRNMSGSGGTAPFDWTNSLESFEPFVTITKGVVYRVEVQLYRHSANEFGLSVWLYDEAVSVTVPAFEPADFVDDSSPFDNLTEILWSYTDARALFQNWMFGASGQTGATYVGGSVKFSGFAVSMTGPVGQYPVAGSGEAA